MTFRVTGEPLCPGCCVKLASVVITFNEGWAFCPVCTAEAIHAQVHLRYVLHHDVMYRSSILSHGLRFYLPTPQEGTMLNAIDEYERLINNPVEAPTAIAAWPGFTLEQLPQAARDRDTQPSIPYRRSVSIPHGYEVAGVCDDGRTLLVQIKSEEPA